VQYSVFEARLLPQQIDKLKKQLTPYVREAKDSIRFYYIGAEDISRIQVIGGGKVTEDKVYFIQ
jgi:CRISPR-associated endonuclease Cas2